MRSGTSRTCTASRAPRPVPATWSSTSAADRAYHVAIYAGHGWQYAAADPQDGIRYQRIWTVAVEFRTDWH